MGSAPAPDTEAAAAAEYPYDGSIFRANSEGAAGASAQMMMMSRRIGHRNIFVPEMGIELSILIELI
jgi:hypothetical protein